MTITKLNNRFNQIKQASQVLKQRRLKALLEDIAEMKMNDRLEVLTWQIIDEFNCSSVELIQLINDFKFIRVA